jgi:hypothetical protein
VADPQPRTPEWWVDRLNRQLDARRDQVDLFDRYYTGNHPLPGVPDHAKGAFRRWLRQSRANWMELVISAVTDRLDVDGFRWDSQEADDEAWDIWQANDLDVGAEEVHTEALVSGESYVLVAPDDTDREVPLLTVEHPSQVIVANDPARRRVRTAAFKKWCEDDGYLYAVLYLPDEVYKLVSADKAERYQTGQKVVWEPRDVLDNPLGVVPMVPFYNRRRMLTGGRSELDGVTDIQDRINQTIFLRSMAAQYASFRQRWIAGLDVEIDEATGLPKQPFKPGVTEMFIAPDENTKFGEFGATDLAPYTDSVSSDIQAISAITRTPPHYLLGQVVNISGDALKAAETGLVSKVRSRIRHFSDSWEEVMRLAFQVIGSPKGKVTNAETIWSDPESRTEGELVDALVKMNGLGVPREVTWEKWGASPQEIERWRALRTSDALLTDAATPF